MELKQGICNFLLQEKVLQGHLIFFISNWQEMGPMISGK